MITDIDKESVWFLHVQLNIRKVYAKLVSTNLSQEKQDAWKYIYINFMSQLSVNPDFLGKIIMCDEMWIFQYKPETNIQLTHWKTPTSSRMKGARMNKLINGNLIVFSITMVWSWLNDWPPTNPRLSWDSGQAERKIEEEEEEEARVEEEKCMNSSSRQSVHMAVSDW